MTGRRIRVPFLMYHALGSSTGDPYCLSPDEFRRHLAYLRTGGREAIHIATYLGAVHPARSVVLTFDDGSASDFRVAFPLLREYGYPATFFITTDRVNASGYVTWSELREMSAAGMAIGSHGTSHRYLSDLPPPEARGELLDSRAVLEDRLGHRITWLALPGGRWASWLLPLAREAGYEGVCTSVVGLNDPARDRYLFKRLALRARTAGRFAALVEQSPATLTSEWMETTLRIGVRRLIGNTGYEALRRRLLEAGR